MITMALNNTSAEWYIRQTKGHLKTSQTIEPSAGEGLGLVRMMVCSHGKKIFLTFYTA